MNGGVTYDTGARIAGDLNSRRMWALHVGLLAEGVTPTVPSPVLAEAWRGGSRQANLARMMAMCVVEHLSEEQAKRVGVLAGKSGHGDVVDVCVVEGALRRSDAVITSNPTHMRRVADATRTRLRIEIV